MDAKKAYGTLLAVGKALGDAARDDPALIDRLRAAEDVDALAEIIRAHPGKVPPALADEWLASIPPERYRQERARLIVQAKMVMKGEKPLGPQHKGAGGGGGGFTPS